MVIREMVESDLAQICFIERETFSEPWSEEDFRNSFTKQNNGYLVAEAQEKIIGYCGFWGIAGEGYIYNVAVRKEFRRQQVGFLMLKELIKKASDKGVTALTLEVRCSNEAALQLYDRLGFESLGVRKEFYSKPKEDAVIMWLKPIQ